MVSTLSLSKRIHLLHQLQILRMLMFTFIAVMFKAITNGALKTRLTIHTNVHFVEQLVRWLPFCPASNQPSTSCRILIMNRQRLIVFNHADIWHHNRRRYTGRRLKCLTVKETSFLLRLNNVFVWFSGTKGLKSICPFCSIVLSDTKPYVRLIFQDSIHRQWTSLRKATRFLFLYICFLCMCITCILIYQYYAHYL